MKRIIAGTLAFGMVVGTGNSFSSAEEISNVPVIEEVTIQTNFETMNIESLEIQSITTSQFQKVYAAMKKYEGKPYKYGGNSPKTGFDCSGLMQWGYGTQGIKLPRSAQQQYDFTKRISRSALQPGDLVFFKGTNGGKQGITHVGMYIGNNTFYNSSSSKGVSAAKLDNSYWKQHIAGYGKIK
ncbi:NlpC/P60 family protein [Bacillus clarus]|uniref:NlpC/P60 family protein n=1 Tax=Bacillus clarus TaxID=2338372 RepID=A0A090YCF8_9BACI|nr:C40 family peptidase [Bacillus clarus]KFM95522.1 nlpC/P60 family protein [Bacillus clarus]RFT63487.1 NlpC/P60 family protein [Bacillus clarus]